MTDYVTGMSMPITSAQTQKRMMLNSYEQQLLAARRLARMRVTMRIREGLDADEPEPDPAIKRRSYVEQVAFELFQSLLFTGSDNPVVEDIRKDLSRKLGREVHFTYPPGGRLKIVAEGANGPVPLSREEQLRCRQVLEGITRQRVDQSMLEQEQAGT